MQINFCPPRVTETTDQVNSALFLLRRIDNLHHLLLYNGRSQLTRSPPVRIHIGALQSICTFYTGTEQSFAAAQLLIPASREHQPLTHSLRKTSNALHPCWTLITIYSNIPQLVYPSPYHSKSTYLLSQASSAANGQRFSQLETPTIYQNIYMSRHPTKPPHSLFTIVQTII